MAALVSILLGGLAVDAAGLPHPRGDAAADSVTWGISPATAEGRDARSAISHVVEPGSVFTEHVIIDNFGDEPLALDLYTSDARPANGAFDVTAGDERSEAVGVWLELAQARVEIPARDHLVVEMTVRVPESAEPGDHAGGVLASRRTAGVGDDIGIEIERRVGTRVYLRVAGPITPALAVSELGATHSGTLNPVGRGRVEVGYRVENTGNIRLNGEVVVSVEGPFGLGRRSMPATAVDDLLPGHWIDQQVVVDKIVPLGRYSVDVAATPTGSDGQPLDGVPPGRAETTTSAMPFAFVLSLLVLAFAGWVVRRRRRRRSPPSTGSERAPEQPTAEPVAR